MVHLLIQKDNASAQLCPPNSNRKFNDFQYDFKINAAKKSINFILGFEMVWECIFSYDEDLNGALDNSSGRQLTDGCLPRDGQQHCLLNLKENL